MSGGMVRLVVLAALCWWAPQSLAYTYCHVGLRSNFAWDSNHVYFVQADHSLTVPALETGQCLQRKKDDRYDGALLRVPAGLLNLQDEKARLLDATTL